MHFLVAPNAFKNSLPADEVATALSKGLQQSRLPCTCESFPVADGGDGTANLLVQQLHGTVINIPVHDPLGRMIKAFYGLIDNGRTAVIEMANASGLRLLKPDELNPLRTTTRGTGELIKHALDQGVEQIIICIGGSATVDGATGMLQELGVRFLDAKGKELQQMPESLLELAAIDTMGLDARLQKVSVTVLCDVTNTLLGDQGAAAVFGPQKGATPAMVQQLEASLKRLRDVTLQQTGKDMATIRHGGAAGGMAAAMAAFLQATLLDGIDRFLDLTGFNEALQKADYVITGEGSIDVQTLQGKAPFGVALRAREKKIPVIGVAGKVPVDTDPALQEYFDVLLAIGNGPMQLNEAFQLTEENLVRTGKLIGDMLALCQTPKIL